MKWRVVDSEILVKDRWIELRADRCITPGGVEISPYYVAHYPEWVNVVGLTDDDRVVLVRQYRHGAGDMMLEIPGGVTDATDDGYEHAARREFEEETGYTAPRWTHLGTFFANAATQDNRVRFYLAQGAIPNGKRKLDDGEEGLEVIALPIADVLRGLRKGLLGQGLQVSAIMLALALAGKLDAAHLAD